MSAPLKPEIKAGTRVNITVSDRTLFGLTVVARHGEHAKIQDAVGRNFLVFIDDCELEPDNSTARTAA